MSPRMAPFRVVTVVDQWSRRSPIRGGFQPLVNGVVPPDSSHGQNVYTQVLDGSVREAVERVGRELFTIVHNAEGPSPVSC